MHILSGLYFIFSVVLKRLQTQLYRARKQTHVFLSFAGVAFDVEFVLNTRSRRPFFAVDVPEDPSLLRGKIETLYNISFDASIGTVLRECSQTELMSQVEC